MLVKQEEYKLSESQGINVYDDTDIVINLTLQNNLFKDAGKIYGYVKDSNGNSIPKALIKLMSNEYKTLMSTVSDENGEYFFNNVIANTKYKIYAISSNKNVSFEMNLYMSSLEEKQLDVVIEDTNKIKSSIIAKLVDSNSKNVISGASIYLFKYDENNNKSLESVVFSNETGEFMFCNLLPNNYSVQINALGYKSLTFDQLINEIDKVYSFEFSCENDSSVFNGTIYGIIKDNTGNIVNNADVFLYKINQDKSLMVISFTKTDKNGVYLFVNVPVGKYKVKSSQLEDIEVFV